MVKLRIPQLPKFIREDSLETTELILNFLLLTQLIQVPFVIAESGSKPGYNWGICYFHLPPL